MTDTKDTKNTKKDLQKFSKKSLLQSKKYLHRRDVLNVLINDYEEISTVELDKRIDKFMKGEVK